MTFVLSNVGTPLLWLGCGHLLLGNLCIGLFEGWLLSKWTCASRGQAQAWMIFANYASAWTGLYSLPFIVGFWDNQFDSFPLYHVEWTLVLTVLTAFVMTVLIEAPLVFLAVRRTPIGRGRLSASIVGVQIASYLPLVVLYLATSDLSAITRWDRVPASEIDAEFDGWVYYESSDGLSIRRCRIDSSNDETVISLEGTTVCRRPFEGPTLKQTGLGKCRLEHSRLVSTTDGMANLSGFAGVYEFRRDAWFEPLDFREPEDRFVGCNARGEEGLVFGPRRADGRFATTLDRVAWRTPVNAWKTAFPAILPEDVVVCEFGEQIVLLDQRHKRIAAVCRGRQPALLAAKSPEWYELPADETPLRAE